MTYLDGKNYLTLNQILGMTYEELVTHYESPEGRLEIMNSNLGGMSPRQVADLLWQEVVRHGEASK